MLEASFVVLCILGGFGTVSIIGMVGKYFVKKQLALREMVKHKNKTMDALRIMKGYTYKNNFWKCDVKDDELKEMEIITKRAGYNDYGHFKNLQWKHCDKNFHYKKLVEYVKLGYEPAFMVLVNSVKKSDCSEVANRSLGILRELKEDGVINNIFMEEE